MMNKGGAMQLHELPRELHDLKAPEAPKPPTPPTPDK